MQRHDTSSSLVGRLVVCIACFGVCASVALALVSFRQTQRAYRVELTGRIDAAALTLGDVVRATLETRAGSVALEQLLKVVARDAGLRAVQVWDTHESPALPRVSVGEWMREGEPQPVIWTLDRFTALSEAALDPRRVTQVRVPLRVGGHDLMIEMLADGPAQHRAIVRDTAWRMLPSWAVLAVATLLASVALRLWVLGPLNEVVALIQGEATGKDFERIAESRTGEHSELARALAERLCSAENAEAEAQRREAALTRLFEFAPAALVELDAAGTIRRANARAMRLLGDSAESPLGQPLRRRIDPADRPTLRQLFDRLRLEPVARCELRLRSAGATIEASLEAQATTGPTGEIASIRVALTDRSRLARLHDRLARQSQLLGLTLDHLDEAVVLIDNAGRVTAHNRLLENLLQQNGDQLRNAAYDPARFWSALGWLAPEDAAAKLERITHDDAGMAHATLDSRQGPLRFRSVRVREPGGATVGRLWIVRPEAAPVVGVSAVDPGAITPGDQDHLLHRFSRALVEARDTEALLGAAVEALRDLLGVDSAGLAVRSAESARRCRIVMDRGTPTQLLAPHAAWADGIAAELMPEVLSGGVSRHWPEPPESAGWSAALRATGLQSLAAAPLCGSRDDLGVVWIAEVPGRPLTAEQSAKLEAAAAILAPRLEYLELGQRFCDAGVLDPETLLPTADQFERHAALATVRKPQRPWAAVVLRIDNFATLTAPLRDAERTLWVERVGDRLRARCRRSCFLSRLAEDTFAVWAPDLAADYAEGFAQRLRDTLREVAVTPNAATPHGSPPGGPAPVLSAGLACYPQDGPNHAVVLATASRRAEQAHRLGEALIARDADGRRAAS